MNQKIQTQFRMDYHKYLMKLQEDELDTLPLAHTTKTMVADKDFLLLQYFSIFDNISIFGITKNDY